MSAHTKQILKRERKRLTVISIKINSEVLAPKLIEALAQVETFVMPSNDSYLNIYYFIKPRNKLALKNLKCNSNRKIYTQVFEGVFYLCI